jgi:branched-chain amino acid aminotransferase
MKAASLSPWTAGQPDAYLRLLLTRGIGELTYDPAATPVPTLVIIARPHKAPDPKIYEQGVALSIVPIQRNAPAALNPLIKSNNLLNNALAMQRALGAGGFEAVMRNHRGELAECSQSNLFVVSGGVVRTPPLEAGLLAGITRQLVLELCREAHFPVEETTLHDGDLLEAEEAFITSSTREIVPAVKVDHTAISDGRPGTITKALMAAFHTKVDQVAAMPENSR